MKLLYDAELGKRIKQHNYKYAHMTFDWGVGTWYVNCRRTSRDIF